MTMLGRSKRSLLIAKQKVEGTGAPEGLSSTQWEYTDCVVFSKACEAKFSQYSTTDWFSNSYRRIISTRRGGGGGGDCTINTHLIDVFFAPAAYKVLQGPFGEHAKLRGD